MFGKVEFFKSFEDMKKHIEDGQYLLLVAEKSEFNIRDLPEKTAIVGAIFPRLVFENHNYEEGYILAKMSQNTSALIVENMEEDLDIVYLEKLNSFMLLVDGLSSGIGTFLDNFFELVDENAKIIGGGAGKLTLKQEPIIFSNSHFYQDAAIVIGSYDLMGVGVQHGWEKVAGPFIATQTNNCELIDINYLNAFSVYKEIVEQDSGRVFNEDNFFDIAKSYPFGITRYSKEVVVRDPIMTNGKSITLVGEMDNNSVISILKGSNENLLNAAKEAAFNSVANLNDTKPKQSVLIDCISRYLFLDEEFNEELKNVNEAFDDDVVLWGMLTLGEIANTNKENIEFYNKTCVVGAL